MEEDKEVIELIKNRRSVRNYQNRKINEGILKDIVDCGRLAPSGYNNQPWTFVVIQEQNLRKKLAEITTSGSFIQEAGACIAVFCEKSAATGLEDACAATENMMIAARAYGLDTCWVNSYKKSHSEAVKELLNCPTEMELMTLFSIGYAQEEKGEVSKKSLAEVLEWEKF